MLLKTPKIKFEVIPPKDVEGDPFLMKTTPPQQISPIGIAKILQGIPMDPTVNVLE